MGDARGRAELRLSERSRAAGSARCRLITEAGVTAGEVNFAAGGSRWVGRHEQPGPGPSQAIYVAGRCFWTTSDGWQEIVEQGVGRVSGLGFLARPLDAVDDPEWELTVNEEQARVLFILERSAMLDTDRVRDERLEFTVDESGRIVGIVAHLGSSPPGDPDPLAPAHDETFELHDFGADLAPVYAPVTSSTRSV